MSLLERLALHQNQLTGRVRRMPVLVLSPHSRCNCRCMMCDIWRANANGVELSQSDIAPHVQAFRKLRVRVLVLSGGEALMHKNLWERSRYFSPSPRLSMGRKAAGFHPRPLESFKGREVRPLPSS